MSSVAGSRSMGTPFFHELKKQASYYLKEKVRNARLVLTDVTPAELQTEEATNGNPWAPDTKTMGFISRAAFEIDDYWRVVEILHRRLEKFDRKHWREPYKAMVLLEHLLTHGPESIAQEFESDREVIKEIGTFQHIDERGFNWGVTVRKKSERVLKLLDKGPLLKEARDRARKISRGIRGFGSFNQKWTSSDDGDNCVVERDSELLGRSNSRYEDYRGWDDAGEESHKENSDPDAGILIDMDKKGDDAGGKPMRENSSHDKSSIDGEEVKIVDVTGVLTQGLPQDESKPLLSQEEQGIEVQEQHPFSNLEDQSMESMNLLSQP